ncbi:hypothetical protein RMCBS344292_03035 [Rhizopus microsporus]|nr:hypothetical protein RMCBS344292_03035 [Rhizopus microsporus]
MISVDAPSSPPLSPKSSQSKDFPEWSSPFLNAYENTDKKMEAFSYTDGPNIAPYPTPCNSKTILDEKKKYHNDEDQKVIADLEEETVKLSKELEKIVSNNKKQEHINKKKIQILENENMFLQENLMDATLKIENLQHKTQLYSEIPKNDTFDQNLKEMLFCKMEELQEESGQVAESKSQLESEFKAATKDLYDLRQKFYQSQLMMSEHEQLLNDFKLQQQHIDELNSSLENCQDVIARLRDDGLLATGNALSIISSDNNELLHNSNSSSRSPSFLQHVEDIRIQNNLFTELGNAQGKDSSQLSFDSVAMEKDKENLLSTLSIYNQSPDCNSAIESIVVNAAILDVDTINEVLERLKTLETKYRPEQPLKKEASPSVPPSVISNRTKVINGTLTARKEEMAHTTGFIKRLIYALWRWLKFTVIMIVALYFSIKEGPDGLVDNKL